MYRNIEIIPRHVLILFCIISHRYKACIWCHIKNDTQYKKGVIKDDNMTTTHWIGTASINVLNQPNNLGRFKKTIVNVDPSKAMVDWQNGAPDGATNLSLSSEFTPGYIVSYVVNYELTGTMHADLYQRNYFDITTTDFFTKQTGIIPDIIPQNQHSEWNYGPNNLYPSKEGHVPSRFIFEATTTEVGLLYTAYNMNLTVHYQVTVVKSCSVANINDPICSISCLNNVNACTATYNAYCLDPNNPARIAEPVCYNYYGKYINVNLTSDSLIDEQAGRYCLSKYPGGLADLAKSNNPVDIDICSCNLPANSSDTNATILYQNFFNDLEKQIPAFQQFGSQPKCLYPHVLLLHLGLKKYHQVDVRFHNVLAVLLLTMMAL
jgi:hypothetical protein